MQEAPACILPLPASFTLSMERCDRLLIIAGINFGSSLILLGGYDAAHNVMIHDFCD